MKTVTHFFWRRVAPPVFWTLVLASPAYAQGGTGTGEAAAVAEQIRDLLIQVLIIVGPVAILAGFAMMSFGGFNPSFKQRGIEVIKWTVLGALGIALAAGILWGLVEPLLAGGGAGG